MELKLISYLKIWYITQAWLTLELFIHMMSKLFSCTKIVQFEHHWWLWITIIFHNLITSCSDFGCFKMFHVTYFFSGFPRPFFLRRKNFVGRKKWFLQRDGGTLIILGQSTFRVDLGSTWNFLIQLCSQELAMMSDLIYSQILQAAKCAFFFVLMLGCPVWS